MGSISIVLCNHRGSISFVLLCIHIGSYSSVLLCCYICTPGRPYPGTIFPLLFAPCHNYNYVPNRLLTHWVAWYWTRPFCRHRSWDESRNILCNILLEAQSAFQNRRNDLRGIYVPDSSYQGNRFGLQSIDHLHSKQEWRSAIVRDWENDTQVWFKWGTLPGDDSGWFFGQNTWVGMLPRTRIHHPGKYKHNIILVMLSQRQRWC